MKGPAVRIGSFSGSLINKPCVARDVRNIFEFHSRRLQEILGQDHAA